MRSHFLSVAATAFVFSSVAYAQSLHDYLVAQKWNAVKSGPLIAIGAKEQWPRPVEGQDQPPATMDSYGRQLVKIGRLTVAAPLSRLDFPDDGLANPYDALTDQDKFIALLGSLNASQWHQLSSGGIAPRDLSGQLKKLLLALIPHPLKAQEFVYGKDGYGSTGEPIPITSEVVQGVKLQLFKALDVGFSPLIDPISKAAMNYGVSSGSYRPPGTHVYRAASNDARAGYGGYAGRFVDNDEKPSQLDYKNPALAKPVAVGQSETVSTLVAKAAQAGGLEIWADARIAKDEVDIFGEQATASELLRGLARAVCGTYRRVGGTYVLTSDLEGLATRGTRALAARALVKLDVQSKVAELRDRIR
ncbi:MAG: hypothetical protein P4L46_08210, partial [Fimbriimonas sp.]|nr:hypothetical protein [Fimbriimonas sp.]